METDLKHWMFHIDYPHSRREWATETTQMMHDGIFWGTMAMLAFTVLFVGLVLWSVGSGTSIANSSVSSPISLPYPHWLMR